MLSLECVGNGIEVEDLERQARIVRRLEAQQFRECHVPSEFTLKAVTGLGFQLPFGDKYTQYGAIPVAQIC